MSETTKILFNSPALHSLKREQLVKLCKIHSLKANGKNVEIIERLKVHALGLPTSDPLSIATRSEAPRYEDSDTDDVDMQPPSPSFAHSNMPRPSEQWEVVMDDIEEVEEKGSRSGTLSSMRTISGTAGEFGTGTAGSKSSVTSSIKALANSLGLKRTVGAKTIPTASSLSSVASEPPVEDELSQQSTRYSRLPEPRPSDAPLADHFKFSTPDTSFGDEPLPGDGARPGKPAPMDSRLSLGTGGAPGPTTTIRLVSAAPAPRASTRGVPDTPQLKPFATSFDLLMGSPEKNTLSPGRPMTPGGASTKSLYPTLPLEDLADARAHLSNTPIKALYEGTPSSIRPRNDVDDLFSPSKLKAPAPAPAAFVFGSPLPQPNAVTNKAFNSAADSVLAEMNRRLSEAGAPGAKLDANWLENRPRFDSAASGSSSNTTNKPADRFAKAHEEQFAKMDSIATHYAARRPAPATRPSGGVKRKSDALGRGVAPRASAGKRAASGAYRRAPIPGGFGDEDDSEDEGEASADREQDRRASKRIRVEEGDGGLRAGKRPSIAPSAAKQEATRRALEIKKERRRSSVRNGRASIAPAAAKAKAGGSRFGFMASAKSVVRSLWGSSKPATAAAPAAAKPAPPAAKPVPALGKVIPTPVNSLSSKIAPESSDATAQKTGSMSSGRSLFKPVSKARSVNPPPSAATSRQSVAPQGHARTSSVASIPTARVAAAAGHHRANSVATVPTVGGPANPRSNARPSSIPSAGAKPGHTRLPSLSTLNSRVAEAPAVSSMGTRRSGTGTGIPSSTSRLHAPTASSLAKTRGTASTSSKRPSTLSAITNSPGPSPRKDAPSKIFSSPLGPSMIPSPVKATMSLGAAAATLAATAGADSSRPRAPMARRPRVSRSKVIAKLGAQRAAGESKGTGTLAVPKATLAPRASGPAPRLRSSTGAAARRSFAAGSKARGSDVLLSAKKHARQSEHARRRTRAGGSTAGAGLASPGKGLFAAANASSGSAMDLDD